ncbi:hypothetical protein BDY19DRAFT_14458 [Irpex rosettiformis]|uniref:Uncharacterized protein n=1 Tax=Irpex rosettiformis TaxID=378272 RepID=A0ACB8UIX4_9APHY|nr:hypothetical protein BDY19DRAFT_14458 [Irpex rosettiformis]
MDASVVSSVVGELPIESKTKAGNNDRTPENTKRKGWWTRQLSKVLGRGTSKAHTRKSQNRSSTRSLPISRRPLKGHSVIKLNLSPSTFIDPRPTLVEDNTPHLLSLARVVPLESSTKRKLDDDVENIPYHSQSPVKKKHRNEKDQRPTPTTSNSETLATSRTKAEKEKQRQKEKKKRQRAAKRLRTEKEYNVLILDFRRKEPHKDIKRFCVNLPLERVSKTLRGGSVSGNFRGNDLEVNNTVPVSLAVLLQSPEARSMYECLQRPLYFDQTCTHEVEALKQSLNDSAASSKLKIIEVPTQPVKLDPDLEHPPQCPTFGLDALHAIQHALNDVEEPHHLESSQNSEDKIKYLLKPVLKRLGFENILVTNGWKWKEKIGLRSTLDQRTHEYVPNSDVAIVLDDGSSKILVPFEVHPAGSQSNNTPDMDLSERVRLLIQGSYISLRDSRPSVVLYLTRDRQMETIIIFRTEGMSDQEKFCYYAEKRPFYSRAARIQTLSQVINLVYTRSRC